MHLKRFDYIDEMQEDRKGMSFPQSNYLPLIPIDGPLDGLEEGAGREEDLVLAVVSVLRRDGAHVARGVGDAAGGTAPLS